MTTSRRPTLAARLRTTALAAVLAATSFIVTAAPGSRPADTGSSPFEGIVRIANELFAPKAALAAYCASNPTFTGYLTASTSSHPQAAGITDPDLYAWVSNVDSTWSCTAFYRFDGVAWNTTASAGRFDWGLLITSTSVACNYDVGSNDYIKGNGTTDCPDTDAEYALQLTLTTERVYQQDVDHDSVGDLSFVHSDCSTAYGNGDGEKERGTETAPENFNAGNVDNRPGANCDPLTIDALRHQPDDHLRQDGTDRHQRPDRRWRGVRDEPDRHAHHRGERRRLGYGPDAVQQRGRCLVHSAGVFDQPDLDTVRGRWHQDCRGQVHRRQRQPECPGLRHDHPRHDGADRGHRHARGQSPHRGRP